LGVTQEERRLWLAQVVDEEKDHDESAILEGKAFKYLLRLCARMDEGKLREREDKAASYDHLLHQPNLFRGHVVVVRRAVVIEVFRAELTPEYGLPGYEVLPALLVNQAHELFEARILTRTGSPLFEKLNRGILDRKNPVLRLSGFFMKNHLKLTSREGEGPWRAPLLVAPEPSLSMHSVDAEEGLREGKVLDLLPSITYKAPKTGERLVAELFLPGAGARPGAPGPGHSNPAQIPMVRIAGWVGAVGDTGFMEARVRDYLSSVPPGLAASGVLLLARGVPSPPASLVLSAMRQAGLPKVFFKDENEVFVGNLGREK
jgi:hypothetical protein